MILDRRQVRLLIPLGLAISLSLPGDQTLYAVLPTQHDTVGISLGMVGMLLGINRVIRIPGNPVAGLLYDQLGRRRLFLLGLLLGLLSTASYAIARNFSAWLAGRLLWGVAWSLINVGGLTMVLDVTEDHDRGRVTGLYQMSLLLGLAFSPVLGGLLTDALGFRPALLFCAAITGVGLFIAFFTLPETRPTPPNAHFQSLRAFVASLPRKGPAGKQTGRGLFPGEGLPWSAAPSRAERPGSRVPRFLPRPRSRGARDGAGSQDERGRGSVSRLTALASGPRGRQVAINYTYLMTFFAGNGVVMSTISLYLKQNFGDEILFGNAAVGVASLGGTLLAMRSLMGMVAGPLSGYLSDRLGDRWPVVRWGIVMGGIGFGVLVASGGIWAVPVGVALIALSSGALLTSLAALTGDLATSERQGLAIGNLATAGDLGSAAGPLLAYTLLSLVDLRWIYLLCGLGFASSLLAVRLARSARDG